MSDITPDSPSVLTALISLGVALVTTLLVTPIKYWFDSKALLKKMQIEYEYEQKKSLKILIGKYHGRMIEAGERINARLWKVHGHHEKGWLNYEKTNQNFTNTTLYRLLNIIYLCFKLEEDAIFIDQRISEKNDLYFLYYSKAIIKSITDVEKLFLGIEHDFLLGRDHVLRDNLKKICDLCHTTNGFIDLNSFETLLKNKKKEFLPVTEFLFGLTKEEPRNRWDRIMIFHLLVLMMLNRFGYEVHKTPFDKFTNITKKMNNKKIINNSIDWFKKQGFDEMEIKMVSSALNDTFKDL